MFQHGPKMAPNGPQMVPKLTQHGTKMETKSKKGPPGDPSGPRRKLSEKMEGQRVPEGVPKGPPKCPSGGQGLVVGAILEPEGPKNIKTRLGKNTFFWTPRFASFLESFLIVLGLFFNTVHGTFLTCGATKERGAIMAQIKLVWARLQDPAGHVHALYHHCDSRPTNFT